MYNGKSIMAEIHARRRLRLRQLIEEKFASNQSAMARAVGLHHSSIRDVFNGLHNPPKVEFHAIEKLLDAGYTQREVTRQLGVHYSTISHAVKRERERAHRSAA